MAAPVLTNLSPNQGMAGSSDITVTINGTGFTDTSVLVWNGADDVCTFVSDTQLTTIVRLSMSTVQIACTVEVRNDIDLSNSLDFYITEDIAPTPPPDTDPVSVNTNAVPAEYHAPEPPDVYQGTPVQVTRRP
jgi:IPT/TIG domain